MFNSSLLKSSFLNSSSIYLLSNYSTLLNSIKSIKYLNKSSKFFSTQQHSRLITPVEIRSRQKRLVENIFKNENVGFRDYLILIPAAIRTFQTDTIIPNIHFKQNSDFIYFTGLNRIDSSDCILSLCANNGKIKETTLYSPTISEHQSIWEGEGIKSNYNQSHINNICDQIQNISKLYNFLNSISIDKPIFTTGYIQRYDQINNFLIKSNSFYTLSNYIDKLRLIKSKEELNAMRRTCKLGSNALKRTIEWSSEQSAVNENQLAALFDYETRINGAAKPSYPSVCAGNDRATSIHYGANCENLKRNDWILMDAGCEDFDGYCSDITRCWQIGSKNNSNNLNTVNLKLQFALYQALNELQKRLINSIFIGNTSLNTLFMEMCDGLLVILKEFGVIEKSVFNTGNSFNQVYQYCPHHCSHFLGLDVHDSRTVSRDVILESGMCFTIEPGLYFRSTHSIKDEFKGIGLRIEDDLIINEKNQVENLTNF